MLFAELASIGTPAFSFICRATPPTPRTKAQTNKAIATTTNLFIIPPPIGTKRGDFFKVYGEKRIILGFFYPVCLEMARKVKNNLNNLYKYYKNSRLTYEKRSYL